MASSGISRSVLAIEWIVCFGFLSLWGVFEIMDVPGLTSGNFEQVTAYLSHRGFVASAIGGLELLISSLGPIGLFLALRYLSHGRGIRRGIFATLAISVLLVSGTVVMAFHAWQGSTIGVDWRGLVLLAVLPAFGYWHLQRVSASGD